MGIAGGDDGYGTMLGLPLNDFCLMHLRSVMKRRQFLKKSAAAATVLAGSRVAKAAASERIRVGVMGAGGRPLTLSRIFASKANAEVVAFADVDASRLPKAVEVVTALQGTRPRATGDFRSLIDDNSIDALVVAAPDHWHAIPTIMACMAGKDVYVEKPAAHNIVEGRRMVAAAMRKYGRVVQMGSQHRTTDRMKSALEFIRTGALGRCLVAKAWESHREADLDSEPDGSPPPGVNYDMWLGPAPQRPFNRNRFHSRWRWFYDYGNGDLGDDGVHRMDMAVAALNAACETQGDPPLGTPRTIQALGGKWYFDDAQECPDTLQVNFLYPAGGKPKFLTYEMRIWAPYSMERESEGAAVYGDQGYIVIGNRRWTAYTARNARIKEVKGDQFAGPHVDDFLDCVQVPEQARLRSGNGGASGVDALLHRQYCGAGGTAADHGSPDRDVRKRHRSQRPAVTGIPQTVGPA